MPHKVGAEFVLLAAIWGASFLFIRIGSVEFGPWATAGVRVGVAALCLLPLLWWRGAWRGMQGRVLPTLAIGVINAGLPFALYAYAVLSISTGLTAILNATAPLFGALIAWLWLGDRLDRSRVLGLALGFLGVALLSWSKASFKPGGTGWAVLACLGATLCYGLAASCTRRFLAGVPPLANATGSLIGASLALAWPTLAHWPSQTPSGAAWAALIASGVLCTALAYILFFRLIEQVGPGRTLTVTFLIPVFAMGYGALFLDERLTPWTLACGLVILAGVGLATGFVSLPLSPAKAEASRPST